MTTSDEIFVRLFSEACQKCFGTPLTQPLSEADSRTLSNAILERTGLVIGTKSIKNYSQFTLGLSNEKKENPSVATLDTLARYVLGSPATTESERKLNESHHPYWHEYRLKHISGKQIKFSAGRIAWAMLGVGLVAFVVFFVLSQEKYATSLIEEFDKPGVNSLLDRDWQLMHENTGWWNKKDLSPGHLTLFTLFGDNWPQKNQRSEIANLLVHKISSPCFSVEAHFRDFVPLHNWQQAGILISADTTFSDKVIRLSISYNDFFGGFSKAPEIIIQGLSSSETAGESKPEEFAHHTLFTLEAPDSSLVKKNLSHSSLKIEKRGNRFRFLYSAGPIETFAFKEIVAKEFSIEPRYVGLFAIQGISPSDHVMPVKFDSFKWVELECSD